MYYFDKFEWIIDHKKDRYDIDFTDKINLNQEF